MYLKFFIDENEGNALYAIALDTKIYILFLTSICLSADKLLLRTKASGHCLVVEIICLLYSALEHFLKFEPKWVSCWLTLLICQSQVHLPFLPSWDIKDIVGSHLCPFATWVDCCHLFVSDIATRKKEHNIELIFYQSPTGSMFLPVESILHISCVVVTSIEPFGVGLILRPQESRLFTIWVRAHVPVGHT